MSRFTKKYCVRVNGETLATCDDFIKAKKVFDSIELKQKGEVKEVYLEADGILDRPLFDVCVG